MLYPLLKGFFEKVGMSLALSNNKSGNRRATSNGQAYRLGSFSERNKRSKNKDPNPLPEESRYGSDEHIVPLDGEGRDTVSSGRGGAADDRNHDAFHVAGGFEPAGVTVSSGPSPPDARRSRAVDHPKADGIVVTKEYNVSEGRRRHVADQSDRAFSGV